MPFGKLNDGGADIFLDAASITGTGKIWRVWQKTVLVPHTMRGAAPADASKWVEYYLSLVAFDCAKSLYRFEALTTHFEDGSETPDPPAEFPQPWAPASPNSLEGAKLDVICTAKVK